MKTIGILVCGEYSDKLRQIYSDAYEDVFITALTAADDRLRFKSYLTIHGELPVSPDECDGWLITGSKFGVYDNLPWMTGLQDFIRKAYEMNVPQVGVCFGHQIMAQALGGQVVKSSKGWGLGFQRYDMSQVFGEMCEGNLDLYAIHQDQVVEVPQEATVIGSNDHCPNAVLLYKGRAFSLQPHPEFSYDFEKNLIESILGDSVEQEFGEKTLEGMKGTVVHNDRVMKSIAEFFMDET